MNPRYVFGLLAVAVVLMGASCEGYRFESSDPCRCPTLVETAPTIDFVGDGQTPGTVTSSWAGGPRPLVVGLRYDAVDVQGMQRVVAERMMSAGFQHDIVNDEDHFASDEWEVYVGGARVLVMIVEPDRDAAEALAPLAEALGTVP
ncbi:MAG: hypothetical protein DWP92_05525 [Armatimonadetes bacterium]|nr:MAG: hypothetical protein DWP92_05525 [Armatimonadota bacterium]